MDHLITCECGRKHRVSKSQAGQQLSCDCGNSLEIPTLRGFSELPPAETSGRDPAQGSIWKGWRGPGLAVCSGIFLLAVLYSGWCFFQSWRYGLDYGVEDFIAEGNAAIEVLGPDELSTVWSDFEGTGLRTRSAPLFQIYNDFSQEQKFKGMIGLGVAAAFALFSIGIWLSAGRKKSPGSM